jgi:UDP:flavonoid glycosyltransferase YjiC (YdhE family)
MKLLIPLFSPATGTWGGITRVTALAEAAKSAGHKVAFCAAGYLKEPLEKRGYPVYSLPEATMFGLPRPLSNVMVKRSQSARIPVKPGQDFGNIWFVLMLSGMARSSYLQNVLKAEEAAARDFGAEFIFTDLDPAAFLLARITRLPIAAAYQSPMSAGIGTLPWKIMNRAVNRVLHQFGEPNCPIQEVFHGPKVLKLVPSIPELEGIDPSRPDIRYLGSLIGGVRTAENFPLKEGKRYIFTYLGTGSVSLIQAREVLPQVFPAGGDTICLVGGVQGIDSVQSLGNVEFHPYLPAESVLPHCDWTICHGGQNTIIQSLQNGVPLLIFPGPIFERRFNARKVQENGAGFMGELPDFNAGWLREKMADQINCAVNAKVLGGKIRKYGGAGAAIRAMEEWLPR